MEMSKPGAEHKKLDAFLGTFVGEEKLSPSPWDPKGGPAKGTFVTKNELDGFWYVSQYTQERGGQVSYRGHGVFGWDDKQKVYTMHWFDNMSAVTTPVHGTWTGNVLRFEMNGERGWHRYIYEVLGETRYSFRLETSQDGKQWNVGQEGTYTRTAK